MASTCAAGEQGGPNLLRSQLVLSDKNGELIMPVIQSGRPTPAAGAPPMPPFALPQDDLKAIAEYLHSVLARAGAQGRPPRRRHGAARKNPRWRCGGRAGLFHGGVQPLPRR